ncbi:MAG: Uma2 family endonuclease [Caldilineaceae bacterium]|nr:Uma2 family endonuclease [Caldilineaceae bacterium]
MPILEKPLSPKATTQSAKPKRLVSLAEFETILQKPGNANRLLELINGEIFEKMPTQQHGLIVSNINRELGNYAIKHKNGRPGVEVRHQATGDDRNSRLPDVSFTRADLPLVEQGSVEHMPDLAVEIKSPSDTIVQMRETAAYYLANGSRLVWLVYPQLRLVEVYRVDTDIDFRNESQMLLGYDVLPGFELAVADVFADPFSE